MKQRKYYAERIFAIVAAIVLLQTLYFKFSGHADSVYIFSKLGVEPYGRIGLGVVELIAALLLLYRKTSLYGAFMGIGLMIGAVGSHVLVLGIEVQEDGGTLFALALTVLISCIIVVLLRKNQLKTG